NAAKLGWPTTQPYPVGGRRGKGPIDGIFVGDGCNMPCTSPTPGASFDLQGISAVNVDDNNITKPYEGPAAAFPPLTTTWQVFGVAYTHLACPTGSSCSAPTTPPTPPSGTQEFFVSRAANVLVATNCDGTTTDDTGIVITDTTQPNFGCKAI